MRKMKELKGKNYFNILDLKGKPDQYERLLKFIHAQSAKSMRDLYRKAGIKIDDYR